MGKIRKSSSSGQVLLITLLVLSVAVTIALSLIGRGTMDANMSANLEESARAFNAAEAGIEDALKSGLGTTTAQALSPGLSYTVKLSQVAGTANVYQLPKKTIRGTTETVWLVSHNSDGSLNESSAYTGTTIKVCWSSEATVPAVETTLLYKRGSSYQVAKSPLESDATRAGTNKFTNSGISTPGCGLSNYYSATIDFTTLGIVIGDTLLALRLTPRYSDTRLAIDPGVNPLPQQGNQVESTGSTAGGVSRKIIVFQQYKAPSSIFDSSIYSQGSFGH
jgi:Tfp pilus assembly protein PilX